MSDEEAKKRRKAILDRIRALRAKTVENGATEHEAMAAAAKVAELLEQYDVDQSDLDVQEAGVERVEVASVLDEKVAWKVASAIGELTMTVAFVMTGTIPLKYSFLGQPHDVEVAEYLFQVCLRAMEGDSERYRQSQGLLRKNVRERRVRSFLAGMSERLAERVKELAVHRRETGKGLIPLKNSLIDEEAAKWNLKSFRTWNMSEIDDESFGKGKAAGEKVGLHRGVTQDEGSAQEPRQLARPQRLLS